MNLSSAPSPPPASSLPPAGSRASRRRPWATRGIVYSLWAYLLTLGMIAVGNAYLPRDSRTRTVLVFLPFLTVLLLVCVIYWVHRAQDEYLRRKIQRSVVITAIVLTFATLGYFCLEMLGYPRQSMITVNLFGWAVFSVQLLFVIHRSR